MKKSILTSIALVLVALAANAQSTTASHRVKVIAASILEIEMTSTADVVMNFTTSSDYDNGVTALSAAELKVKSNKGWQVAVSTTATNFDAIDALNDAEIAASALKVRKTGTTGYNAITSGNAIANGNKGGHTAGRVFNIDYSLNPGYFAADTYVVPVTFTVSNP